MKSLRERERASVCQSAGLNKYVLFQSKERTDVRLSNDINLSLAYMLFQFKER